MASTASFPAALKAVLGPTNTGKTHLAVERMRGYGAGVIGLPLRLLAREIYDRLVKLEGAASVALITGEERIAPPQARFFVCTTEAMPLDKRAPFVAIDEAQLGADPERGHVFTQALLHARGEAETMILGADTLGPLVRKLLPRAEHDRRERFSTLSYAGACKLSRLPRRSAVVAFSAEEVYAIAEYLKRTKGGAAVVMGALSPRTRNAQVDLYQSGEVDFLVATDAIGMGLNMDVGHVAFASLIKFDGRRRRPLMVHELAQIAGRAGRFRTDGVFGVTGDAEPLADDVVARIEDHRFEPITKLQWRNPFLRFDDIAALIESLEAPSPDPALVRLRHASDENALRVLAEEPKIAGKISSPLAARRLWAACQIPDFRKSTPDQHVRLVAQFAGHLLSSRGVLPIDWAGGEIKKLDDDRGEVDALSARLAHIRTWTYAANRSDWFDDPAHWRGVAQSVEDRLSDALHERLTQRFVDRRTSALVRGLKLKDGLEVAISDAEDVVVEGHFVGRLDGLVFLPDREAAAHEAKALRAAAESVLRPEIDRRLGALARSDDEAFSLDDLGGLRWRGAKVGRLAPGPSELQPRIELHGGDLGSAPSRERARARLASWVDDAIDRSLGPLRGLERAIADGRVHGLARGLAFQLVERLGAAQRREVAEVVDALSAVERRELRALGVRFGEALIFVPALVKPHSARLSSLLFAFGPRGGGEPPLPPAPGRTSLPADARRSNASYVAAGYLPLGPRAVRLDIVERLADLLRAAREAAAGEAGVEASAAMASLLGCGREDLAGVLRALGYRRARKSAPTADADQAAPELWRPQAPKRGGARRKDEAGASDTPFAALADLKPAPEKRGPGRTVPAGERPARRVGPRRRKPKARAPL